MANIRNMVNISLKQSNCQFCSFTGLSEDKEHIALIYRDAHLQQIPWVRIHSECLTGDLFGSNHCDCGEQLNEASSWFSLEGGIILYLRQEGRGIGLYNKIDAYALQKSGLDTFEANNKLEFPDDLRQYQVAAEMLKALNIFEIKLLSNNPDKYQQLIKHGIMVREWKSTGLYEKKENAFYLKTKMNKTKHQYNISNIN